MVRICPVSPDISHDIQIPDKIRARIKKRFIAETFTVFTVNLTKEVL